MTVTRDLILANEVAVSINGCDDVIFSKDDFMDYRCWYKFKEQKEMSPMEFKNKRKWLQYFFIFLGLLEACIIVHGDERSGKSLWMAYFSYWCRELFGKKVTLNWHAPPEFGKYDFINPTIFVEEYGELTRVAYEAAQDYNEMTGAMGEVHKQKLKQNNKMWNRIYCYDEAHKVMPKRGLTKYGLLNGDLIKIRGHNHNSMVFSEQNIKELAREELRERATHTIECSYNLIERDKCFYKIHRSKPYHMTRTMQLTPEKWSRLWDTHNVIGMREVIDKKVLNAVQKQQNEYAKGG